MTALTNALKTRFENDLKAFEPNREAVENSAIDLLNLNRKATQQLNNAAARVDAFHDIIVAEQTAGNIYPWAPPRLAAVALEGVFAASVAAWLAAGAPTKNAPQLRPGVARLVDLQVRLFAASIGDK